MPKVSNWKDNYERAAKAHKLHSALCLNGEWHSAFYIRDERDRAYYDDDDLYNNLPEGKHDTPTDSFINLKASKKIVDFIMDNGVWFCGMDMEDGPLHPDAIECCCLLDDICCGCDCVCYFLYHDDPEKSRMF